MKLKKGDYIVHTYHGVGKIKEVDVKKLNGKKRSFFRVQTDTMTFWLPLKRISPKKIRKISAPSTINNALSTIRKKPRPLGKNYKARRKNIQEKRKKISLKTQAKLIRDLNGQLEQNKNVFETSVFEKVKKQFIDEWQVSAEINRGQAEQKLNKALSKSIAEMEQNQNDGEKI